MREKSSPNVYDGDIKAYCIDLNWERQGKRGRVARLGAYAKTNPADHFAWYKMMGVNVIQTFCVSLNGYAWYKNGIVPEQPGLKYDYLPEMVRMGHAEGMKVFGYYTIGFNPLWAKLRPDQNYTANADGGVGGGGYHIVYTDAYLEYLSNSISDAVEKTGIDGFMIDWLWQPTRKATKGRWIEAEKKLYEQLMGKAYPGDEMLTRKEEMAYSRKALTRAWRAIQKAAKDVNPECKVWLTVNKMDHPHMLESAIYQEVDWLMNEAGDLGRINRIKDTVGSHTRLITCMAAWTGVNATEVVPKALAQEIGLYGFSDPKKKSVKQLKDLLAKPVWGLKGDDRNIATLARAYHGVGLNTLRHDNGEWVEIEASEKKEKANTEAVDDLPNVVVITADDLPWTDLGVMGSTYASTPNLDRLAKSGAFFPRAYVPTPWSRASLMTLLTGRYAREHRITVDDHVGWAGSYMANNHPITTLHQQKSIPKLLKERGYLSYQSGRWFEGSPWDAGFTHATSEKGGHSHDRPGIGEEAISGCKEFIDMAQEKKKPFFLWYAPALPAFNYNVRAPKSVDGLKTPSRLMQKQRFILGHGMRDGYFQFQEVKNRADLVQHYALVEWFDEHCGKLISHLEERGLRGNTLIVFQSATGWVSAGRKVWHAPMTKGSPYNGGVRTPTIYSWPEKIKAGTRDDLVSSVDVLPTILAAVKHPKPPQVLPGVNLMPVIEGREDLGDRPVFGESYDRTQLNLARPEQHRLNHWVIQGPYKLIMPLNGEGTYAGGREKISKEPELYHLIDDPYEKKNLYTAKPDVATSLKVLLNQQRPSTAKP